MKKRLFFLLYNEVCGCNITKTPAPVKNPVIRGLAFAWS
jgi:hypothetical protein